MIAITNCNSIPEFMEQINLAVKDNAVVGIGVVLLNDNMTQDEYTTHQFGLSVDDLLLTAEMFIKYAKFLKESQ